MRRLGWVQASWSGPELLWEPEVQRLSVLEWHTKSHPGSSSGQHSPSVFLSRFNIFLVLPLVSHLLVPVLPVQPWNFILIFYDFFLYFSTSCDSCPLPNRSSSSTVSHNKVRDYPALYTWEFAEKPLISKAAKLFIWDQRTGIGTVLPEKWHPDRKH